MSIDTSHENFNNVIETLKKIYGLKSDRKLALKIDVLPASLSNSKKRGVLPFEKIISAAIRDKLSLDVIFNNIVMFNNTNISNTIKITKAGLVDISLLNDEMENLRIPLNISVDSNLKGYISNNITYIINLNEIKPEHNSTYLLKSNDIYYIKHLSIELTGSYILKDEDGSITNINKKELENVLFIGRVEHKFNRTSLI